MKIGTFNGSILSLFSLGRDGYFCKVVARNSPVLYSILILCELSAKK